MKPYDFERLFTNCQNDKQPAENNPFTMQPGICWFKNTNGYPDIETLEDILAMGGKFDPEDELYSDEGFDFAAEEKTIKRDTETIRCGIQDSPFIATIPASFIEIPDGEYTTALVEIVFKKDPDSNLFRYIMQSDDTNALFYGIVQQEDALRDIFIASHLHHYSGLCGLPQVPPSRSMQVLFPWRDHYRPQGRIPAQAPGTICPLSRNHEMAHGAFFVQGESCCRPCACGHCPCFYGRHNAAGGQCTPRLRQSVLLWL